MSALHVYVLMCDAPGCGARFARDLPRADLSRHVAMEEGWVHGVVPANLRNQGPVRSLDYCPKHVALGEDLSLKTLPEYARAVEVVR